MTFSIVSAPQPFSEHSLATDVFLGIEDAHPRKAAPLLREAQKLVEKLVIVGKNGLIVSRLFCAYRIGTSYHFNERSRSPVRCLLFIIPILRTENRVPATAGHQTPWRSCAWPAPGSVLIFTCPMRNLCMPGVTRIQKWVIYAPRPRRVVIFMRAAHTLKKKKKVTILSP